MGRSGKELITSLDFRTRNKPKNKQKATNSTTDVAIKYFVEIIEEFNDVTYPGFRSNKSQNNLLKIIFSGEKHLSYLKSISTYNDIPRE